MRLTVYHLDRPKHLNPGSGRIPPSLIYAVRGACRSPMFDLTRTTLSPALVADVASPVHPLQAFELVRAASASVGRHWDTAPSSAAPRIVAETVAMRSTGAPSRPTDVGDLLRVGGYGGGIRGTWFVASACLTPGDSGWVRLGRRVEAMLDRLGPKPQLNVAQREIELAAWMDGDDPLEAVDRFFQHAASGGGLQTLSFSTEDEPDEPERILRVGGGDVPRAGRYRISVSSTIDADSPVSAALQMVVDLAASREWYLGVEDRFTGDTWIVDGAGHGPAAARLVPRDRQDAADVAEEAPEAPEAPSLR